MLVTKTHSKNESRILKETNLIIKLDIIQNNTFIVTVLRLPILDKDEDRHLHLF